MVAERALEDFSVRPAHESLLVDGAYLSATAAEAEHHVRSQILVGKQRKLERLHAVVLSSQTCSPFSTAAAYRNAAARPSAESCGY